MTTNSITNAAKKNTKKKPTVTFVAASKAE